MCLKNRKQTPTADFFAAAVLSAPFCLFKVYLMSAGCRLARCKKHVRDRFDRTADKHGTAGNTAKGAHQGEGC